MPMKVFFSKIKEALLSALPITLIVYAISLLPWFNFSGIELIVFSVSAALLILGIGMFSMGADLAMTPMGTHVGAGLSRQKKLWLLLLVSFVLGILITVAEPDLQVLADTVSAVMNRDALVYAVGWCWRLFDHWYPADRFPQKAIQYSDAFLYAAVCCQSVAGGWRQAGYAAHGL